MTRPADRPSTSAGRLSTGERRGRERRVLVLGLGISALMHIVAIVLVSHWLVPDPEPAPQRSGALVLEPPHGMRAVEVRPVTDDPAVLAPDIPDPDREMEPTPEEERQVVVEVEAPPATASPETRTAAERLTPRVIDPRLWRPMVLVPGEVTFEDVQARIAAAVELMSDSALAEADAAMRARDWTVEDTKGGKWGISPGKLHLGSVVLPLPIFAVASPDQIQANAVWLELDQQQERALILESFEERVRVIRERRERERSGARAGDNGGD